MNSFLNHMPDWFVAAFTALLAFVTYKLVNATVGLRHATDKLWEAGERQIEIAKISADAAKAASETADRSLKITQRAYIGVEPGGIRPHRRLREGDIGSARDVTGHFRIVNVGKLPARDLSWVGQIVSRQDRNWKPPGDLTGFERFGDDMVVTPGTRMRRATKVISSAEFPDATPPRYCYVWGQVRYRDGLDSEMRITNFCHRYNCGALGSQDYSISKDLARYHETGNDGT